MSLDQDLVRLVREVVKAELNSSRTNATEIVGRGGDTVLSSMGNIFIQPGTNKKAYYHETEIGSGSGAGGGVSSVFGRTGAVVAVVTDYAAIGMRFNDFYGNYFYGDSTYLGYISGAASDMTEGHWHYGVKVVSQLGPTTSSFYIGEDPLTIPNGVAILTSGIYLSSTGGVTVHDFITLDPTAGDPAGANGRLAYNSTSGKFRAYQAGAWIDAIGGVTDHGALTGLADDDHTQYLLITGARNMGGTLLPNASGAYNLGGVSNLWNVIWSKYIGGGDAQYDWIDFATASTIKVVMNSTPILTFTDAAITAAVSVFMGNNYIYFGSSTSSPSIDNGGGTNLILRAGSGSVINAIHQLETFSNIVPYVSGQSCGTAGQKWSLVRGTTITSGDIGFDERMCAICGEELKVGEILSLIVVETEDMAQAPTRCVPVHHHHKHNDNFTWTKK